MLNDDVQSYLAVRRAAGFDLRATGILLQNFTRFASGLNETHVRTQTAVTWASLAPSPSARDERLKTVIRFARYIRAEDTRHEIPPDGVFGHRHYQRRIPFIFSPSEVARIIEKALRLGPTDSLTPYSYATLFALLWATGLRICEALALRLEDITPDGLIIRKTKFRKSRLIPLHGTAVIGLRSYIARRVNVAAGEDHLFISARGRPLQYETVRIKFNALARAAGIQRIAGEPSPHIHGLRHTFAVRGLERCPEDRNHIGRHMLALSTYMGHAHISDTYWYLEAAPQLLSNIAAAYEAFIKKGGA